MIHYARLGQGNPPASEAPSGLSEAATGHTPGVVGRVLELFEGWGEYAFVWHIIVVVAAVVAETEPE